MKKSLLVTIMGFVLAALAAIGAPQPMASPAALAQPLEGEADEVPWWNRLSSHRMERLLRVVMTTWP
jgi:hypothetical protein